MSKKIVTVTRNLNYHVQELKVKLKAIYENKRQMPLYVGKPKYDMILAYLPKLEEEVNEHKMQIEFYSKELSKCKYEGNEDFENWYS